MGEILIMFVVSVLACGMWFLIEPSARRGLRALRTKRNDAPPPRNVVQTHHEKE